jgi:oligopeptide/dipeptide ABC transporter ATP-binding protein
LRILSEIADNIAVMYAGDVVEHARVSELLDTPLHPYTNALLRCLPERSVLGEKLQEIPGRVPSIFEFTENCRFLSRCPYSSDICKENPPPRINVTESHSVLCHNFLKGS